MSRGRCCSCSIDARLGVHAAQSDRCLGCDFGTFVNLPYNLTNFSDTYHVGRLSWILPGYLAHALLPPVAATVCLHLAVFYAATLGCYFCLRATVGRRSAVAVSLILGAYQPFIDAVGWDYVDGCGLAYFLLACACGTAAIHGKRPWLWSTASGCVRRRVRHHEDLAWLMLIPGFFIYLACLSSGRPFVQRARLVLAIGAGTAAVTIAMRTRLCKHHRHLLVFSA